MKKYYTYTVKKLISVQHLVTIEQFKNISDFSYPEEAHDFYEFVYVEDGKITCKNEDANTTLTRNDFFLILPGSKHSYFVDKNENASILIVCFKSKSNIISIIKGRRRIDGEIKELLEKILKEAKSTFVFPINNKLILKENPMLGSQQLIENYIEEVLIKLVQDEMYIRSDIQVMVDASEIKKSIVNEVVGILRSNIYGKVSLSNICDDMFYSKTYLNGLFKEMLGVTIMQYYQDLKINEAKKLLDKREKITTIADKLHYESPQYFAKIFKKKVGLTPTEYKKINNLY